MDWGEQTRDHGIAEAQRIVRVSPGRLCQTSFHPGLPARCSGLTETGFPLSPDPVLRPDEPDAPGRSTAAPAQDLATRALAQDLHRHPSVNSRLFDYHCPLPAIASNGHPDGRTSPAGFSCRAVRIWQ